MMNFLFNAIFWLAFGFGVMKVVAYVWNKNARNVAVSDAADEDFLFGTPRVAFRSYPFPPDKFWGF